MKQVPIIAALFLAGVSAPVAAQPNDTADIHRFFSRELPGARFGGERVVRYSGEGCTGTIETRGETWRVDWALGRTVAFLEARADNRVGVPLAGEAGFLTGSVAGARESETLVIGMSDRRLMIPFIVDRIVAACRGAGRPG